MSAETIIVGIGVLILTAGISFYFLRQRYRKKPVQWRGGIPMSGISQMLFLGGLLSVAIGALTEFAKDVIKAKKAASHSPYGRVEYEQFLSYLRTVGDRRSRDCQR